jgi:hypothetical protein
MKKENYKWIRFADQWPTEPKKIVARHLTTPDIIGEPHYFDPNSDNTRRANLYAFEWSYVEENLNTAKPVLGDALLRNPYKDLPCNYVYDYCNPETCNCTKASKWSRENDPLHE